MPQSRWGFLKILKGLIEVENLELGQLVEGVPFAGREKTVVGQIEGFQLLQMGNDGRQSFEVVVAQGEVAQVGQVGQFQWIDLDGLVHVDTKPLKLLEQTNLFGDLPQLFPIVNRKGFCVEVTVNFIDQTQMLFSLNTHRVVCNGCGRNATRIGCRLSKIRSLSKVTNFVGYQLKSRKMTCFKLQGLDKKVVPRGRF